MSLSEADSVALGDCILGQGASWCQESKNGGGRQKHIAVPSIQSDVLLYNRPMGTPTKFDWSARHTHGQSSATQMDDF